MAGSYKGEFDCSHNPYGEYWGYFPKFDLRCVYFSSLESLEFGNWAVMHDWHIDWTLKHKETLQELILDDCPLTTHLLPYSPLDMEMYLENPIKCWGIMNHENIEQGG